MPLYVFECPHCKRRHERLRRLGDTEPSYCVEDQAEMPRVYGYSVAIGQPEPDRRGMFRRFQEASVDLEAQGVSTAGLWDSARRKAQAIVAAGENPYRPAERI